MPVGVSPRPYSPATEDDENGCHTLDRGPAFERIESFHVGARRLRHSLPPQKTKCFLPVETLPPLLHTYSRHHAEVPHCREDSTFQPIVEMPEHRPRASTSCMGLHFDPIHPCRESIDMPCFDVPGHWSRFQLMTRGSRSWNVWARYTIAIEGGKALVLLRSSPVPPAPPPPTLLSLC